MGNFDYFNRVPSKNFFSYINSAYDNESTLYDKLMTEAFNKHGIPMVYYVISYDTTYDPLFGEDNNRRVVRYFPVMTYYELPREDRQWNVAAMEILDNFHLFISKRHFIAASKLDLDLQQTHDPYTPKVGDIIKSNYNNFFYEITHVAHEEEMFIQRKHSWDVVVKQYKRQHIQDIVLSGTNNVTLIPS